MKRWGSLSTLSALAVAVLPVDPGQVEGPRITGLDTDKAQYTVGDQPVVTAAYSGGTGFIEPGHLRIASGTPLALPPLAETTRLWLSVEAASGPSSSRELTLEAAYRNTFTPVDAPFERTAHVDATLPDGRVLFFGGEDNGGAAMPAQVLAFDATDDRFTVAGELRTGRVKHTATALADGTVLIVGGRRGLDGAPVAERFDPRTGLSRPTTNQPAAHRLFHTATRLADGRVLLAGGQTVGGTLDGDTFELFDAQADLFIRLSSRLAVPRLGHSALLVAPGRVMLFGGVTARGAAAPPEIFDVARMASSGLPRQSFEMTTRVHAAAGCTPDGDALIVGGQTHATTPLPSAVLVAAGGGALCAGPALLAARCRHAVAGLTDGRVLVSGGTTARAGRPVASTELLPMDGGAAVPGPDMAKARVDHTATRLGNGKVLVFGGQGGDRRVLAGAELFG